MAHSFSLMQPLTCPDCGQSFQAEIWLIVDVDERPDLAQRIREGTLHRTRCPNGDEGEVDAPLLLFRPVQTPPLLFSPAERTSAAQDQEQAMGLLAVLRENLGAAWRDEWVAGLQPVPRAMLPAALGDDPAAFTELEAAAQEAMVQAPLLQAVQAFVQAQTWPASQAVVEQHPELLRDEAEALLAQFAAAAQAQGDAQSERIFKEHRALLARCRAVGIPQAFAEKTGNAAGQPTPDLPPEVRAVLEELAARGATFRTPEELQSALSAHLDLQARLLAALAAQQDGPDIPLELRPDLAAAKEAEQRYLQRNDRAALDAACAAWEQALAHPALATGPDALRLALWNDAGGTFLRRYWARGHLPDLNRALALWEQTVAATAADAPALPGYLNNLGNGLRDRYGRLGQVGDLERAIAVYEQAVAATAADAPALPSILNNLGTGLSDRYGRLGQVGDLERAIAVCEQAVAATAADAPALPGYLNNLGSGLSARYGRLGQVGDLERAIAVYEQAVAATAADAPDLPGYLNNLGNGLRDRYEHVGQVGDLERAIAVYEQAVEVTAADAPNLPMYLNNLGNGLRDRYKLLGHVADMEEAQTNYERACEHGMEVQPEVVLASARAWGRWASERRAWEEAVRAYEYGRQALDRLYQSQPLREQRESWLQEGTALPGGMAYALAQLGQYEAAALVLEQGRARELRAALARDRADLTVLEASHPDSASRYRDAADEVRQRQGEGYQPPSGLTLAQAIAQAQAELDAAIEAIRKLPNHADFLAPPSFAELARAVEPGIPLVYLVAAPTGSLALLLHRASANAAPIIEALQGETLTEDALHEWLMGPATENRELGGWFGTYRRWLNSLGDKQAEPRHRQAWHDTLEQTTGQLGQALMGPLVVRLRELGATRAVLVPSGLLALLPLHAAWVAENGSRRYALDDVAFSYAPSAYALNAARATASRAPTQRLVAVDEPLPIKPPAPLPNSQPEVAAIASLFTDAQTFQHGQATRGALLAALPGAHVAHFSCHGGTDWGNALDSALIMAHNEPLTVRDVLALHLSGARLATLSACETGLVGTRLPDEAVALPAALVQAGFAGVVASLWSVSDLSTAMLMEYFYHLWQEKGLEPALALQQAQRWVRDSSNAEKKALFKEYLNAPHATKRIPPVVAAKFLQRMSSEAFAADERFFEHPFWWAAFSLTGV